jgi:hypothetical protein
MDGLFILDRCKFFDHPITAARLTAKSDTGSGKRIKTLPA